MNKTFDKFWVRFVDGANFTKIEFAMKDMGFTLIRRIPVHQHPAAGCFRTDGSLMTVSVATQLINSIGQVECVEQYCPQPRVKKS